MPLLPPSGRRAFLRLLLLLPLLAAAAPAKPELRLACYDFPASFNPVYATGETAQAVANKGYQSLFRFDGQGRPVPELVACHSLSADGTAIRLTLRPGARFADGAPLDSRDVAATLGLLRDPRFRYPYAADLEFLAAVEAAGPLELRLRLRERYAPWKSYLTFKILSAGQLRGADPETFRESVPLGSGPYRLAAVHSPWGFELEANPHWPGELRFGRLRYAVIGEPRQAPLKLLNRELDAAEIHGDDAAAYPRRKSWRRAFRLLPFKKFGYAYLAFNLRDAGLDLNLRRRFHNRLHATAFLDEFLQGRGDRVYSPFLLFGAKKKPRRLPVTAPAARRRLRILTNSESSVRRELVLFLCQEMKAEGVDLKPEFLEYRMFLQRLKRGEFDLAVSSFLLDLDWNLKDILSSDGYFNYAGYSCAEMDDALEAGLRQMDEGKRRAAYERAHDLWRRDLPLIPLFNLNCYMGVRRTLTPPRQRVELIGSCGDFLYQLQGW